MPAVVSPEQALRRRSIFDNPRVSPPTSTPSITQSPTRAAARIIDGLVTTVTRSMGSLMSPNRRRTSGGSRIPRSTSTAIVSGSPRQGHDSKRPRVARLSAITDDMGWGLCTIQEFAHFSVGDHVVIVIPADHKNETKYSIFQRSQFRHRFVNAVGTLVHEGTTAYRASNSSHRKDAENHASTHHGIERNQKVYREIRCSIERYPNRDNYLQDVIPLNELTRQIKQRGGIYLAMLDYYTVVTANKSNVLQLLWTEVPFIQV